jgi:hypothetical protein
MSKPKNPMELVDRYLQAVRFWLPKDAQQEDLLAELGEDLRSQIEAQESASGRPLSTDEASAILKRCGAPMVVASRMGPKKSLIGPALYPIYIFVLKMVLFWILVPVFIFIVGLVNLANSGGDWAGAIGNTIGQLWSALFISAGIVTLVFAILERSSAYAAAACKWDPLSLPPVQQKTERKPSTLQTVCQLIFGVFGLVWLLLISHSPFLILGPAAAFLHASPLVHKYYLPIVLLGVLSLIRSSVTLARPQWTWFPKMGELVQGVFVLILVNFLLKASGQMSNGEWHPFVVVADSVRNSAQYIKVAAIVNVSILLSLAGTWIGLSIAMIVQLGQFVFRKRRTGSGQTATLQVQ